MNRLQLKESENEIQIAQIKGDIAEEKAKQELLEVQILNSNTRSSTEVFIWGRILCGFLFYLFYNSFFCSVLFVLFVFVLFSHICFYHKYK